ncbi:hypothetical protein PAHAL_1G285100 [Panicum hallii]|uniref:Uncharacterized protein n=1 Tax=Panicum hallii TaxID=206008 RepID=A0A2T8KWN0_9POAL|nr:hypothetical protein PAHAL_1G285100 [Panicum hallii]
MERAYALFSGSNRSRRRESTISVPLGLGTSAVDIFKREHFQQSYISSTIMKCSING